MANRSSRPRTAADDLDLTPPEEVRARRVKLLLILVALIITVLGVGLYFAAPPVGRQIKGWQSRRLARKTFALMKRKQWTEANAKARDAYLLCPTEPESWRAIGRLLTRTGQASAALEWWKKVDDAHRLTIDDRRDFAGATLAVDELSAAATQIERLLAAKGGPKPVDIVLAGQLAVRRSDPMLAVDYGQRALGDKRSTPYDILSAATLVLSVTTPQSSLHISAWKQIEDLARDSGNAASLDALAFLATQQSSAPQGSIDTSFSLDRSVAPTQQPSGDTQPNSNDISLSLGPKNATSQRPVTISLVEVADALEKHPDARPYHKLLALQLRAQQDPALTDQYVADAVEQFSKGDDETVAALTEWLNKMGRADKTLQVLPLDRAARRHDLYLRYIDALATLERWNEVKEVLMNERFPLDPLFQHMYLATARARLGEAAAVTNEWNRALEAANTPEKLLAFASYAEQNHANDIADAGYSAAIKLVPRDRTAYAGRLRVALTSGKTAEAQKVAAEIVELSPDDAAARNQDAYLRLLLGASDGAAEAAEREAQVLVAQEPSNWLARATLGLARLRLGKKKDALGAFRDVRATGSEPPGALAVRAAILAVNGYEEGARGDARNLGAEPLLPEERALIAPLLADSRE